MTIRNLVILDINDEPAKTFNTGEGAAKHFVVHRIASWVECQSILSGERPIPPPDLLLMDISFAADNDVRGAMMDADKSIIPVGPMLALPFLNSRPVMGFAPYSGHMPNPHLKQYPPFLVQMGIIAAKMKGGRFTSEYLSHQDSDRSLDEFIKKLKHAGDPRKALRIALGLYQENLSKAVRGKRIYIMNGRKLVSEVQALHDQLLDRKQKDDSIDHSVEWPDDIFLETIDEQSNLDRIRLLSLFADRVKWVTTEINYAGLDFVLEWLNEMLTYEPCFIKAVQAIELQDIKEEGGYHRPRVDEVIRDLFGYLNEDELKEILRLCVLFANVHAYSHFQGRGFQRKDVYTRLGDGVDQRIYQSWFGARAGTKAPPNKVSQIAVSPLAALNPSSGGLERYFLGPNAVLSEDDDLLVVKYRAKFGADAGYDPKWRIPYRVLTPTSS